MTKFLRVILHLLGYPLLLAAVLYLNWNIIMTQTSNYGIFVFVGAIVAVVMGIIYYVCYAGITAKRKKKAKGKSKGKRKRRKQKSIFNQTLRLCLVIVITTTGLWAVCDLALPDFLANATSSTLYYEDLADGWADRAEVNEELLDTFIELSVKANTLPKGNMKTNEAIEYYQSKGLKETLAELNDNEYYKSIGGLLEIQYQSLNANGFQTFTHPWIDFATSERLTIPCLVHLLLDKREIAQDTVTNKDFCKVKENADGTVEVTEVWFAEYDKETKKITLNNVNWTVLDMLGTDNVIDLSSVGDMIPAGLKTFILPLTKPDGIITEILASVARIAGDEELINGKVSVTLEMTEDTMKVVLTPSNTSRGIMGYQEMAWLDSNGLIYALVTLFSCRRLFLIFGAWGVFINLLIGCTRGMCKEERERRRKINAPYEPKPKSDDIVNGNMIYGKIVKW